MKKQYSYIILLLVVLFSGAANAEMKHYIGAQANLGEWTLWAHPGMKGGDRSYGAAGAVGFNYEMQIGPKYGETFFLLNLGLSAQVGTTNYRFKDREFTYTLPSQTDADGETFDYVYALTQRQDRYNKIVAQVPILVGVQHKRFYMLAGAKVGYNVLTNHITKGLMTTYGVYKDTDPLRDVPEMQFFDEAHAKEIKKDGTIRTVNPLSLDLTMELGGRIGEIFTGTGFDIPKRNMEMRLGVFVDYGFTGFIQWKATNSAMTVPTNTYSPTADMIAGVKVNDVMSTDVFIPASERYDAQKKPKGVKDGDYIGHNIMLGLKFTILFLQPEKGKCVLCNTNYNGSPMLPSNRSRSRMKYEE